MRVQLGIRQAGIEIGHWDNLVRRRYREVSTLKTENLTPAKRSSERGVGDCYASGNSDPLAGVNAVHDECEGESFSRANDQVDLTMSFSC